MISVKFCTEVTGWPRYTAVKKYCRKVQPPEYRVLQRYRRQTDRPIGNSKDPSRSGKNPKLNYAHARKSVPVASSKELVFVLDRLNLRIKFDKNRTRNGSAIVDTSLKVRQTGSNLTRMRVYYFRCYWPSNLVFAVRFVTYVPNLRKNG